MGSGGKSRGGRVGFGLSVCDETGGTLSTAGGSEVSGCELPLNLAIVSSASFILRSVAF